MRRFKQALSDAECIRILKAEKAKAFGMKYYPSEEELERELERDFNRVQIIEIAFEHMSGKRVHEK